MPLSIVNNVSSLSAQTNLNKTNSALSKSLERLSTGLRINRGADGPAALVISEQQRSQIAGLKTAIDNTNKAVSVLQTGEGALNEVNGLLTKIRSLALDSANAGVNDASTLAANQAEIDNILSTIDTIANNTKFGTKALLNGSAGVQGVVTGANTAGASAITTGVNAPAGAYTVTVDTQGTGGKVVGIAGLLSMSAAGSVQLAAGGLTSPLTVALGIGDNVNTAATKIQTALDGATSQGGGAGKFVVSVTLGVMTIQSKVLGSAGVTATPSTVEAGTVTGLITASNTVTAGVAMVATVAFNGGSAVTATVSAGPGGLNNQVSYGGATGLNFSIDVSSAGVTAVATSASTVTVTDNSLVFQIGANQNETAKVAIDKVNANALAQGVTGLSNAATTDLSKISVSSASNAQDAIKVVDAAISQVSTIRGRLGAFQTNTLESNARNLSATLESTTAAESVIRDTDFATEIANFTRLQTQVQAGSTVLGNANQTTALIAQLLRG